MAAARAKALAVLAAVLLVPAVAHAGGSVTVRVTVIHASKKGHKVDARLRGLKRQLASFAFTSYKLLSQRSVSVGFGQTGKVSLPGGRVLKVVPERRDKGGKLKVRLTIAHLVDTTYAIAQGGTLIIGGPRYKGGVLILAVTQTAR